MTHLLGPTSRSPRRGLTLVEMLIAMAITLVMMGGVVTLFANISAGVRDRRALIELGSQVRAAREQLNRDLAGATCPATPQTSPGPGRDPAENVGYLEIVEGERSDANPLDSSFDTLNASGDPAGVQLDAATLVPSSQLDPQDGMALGDYDDILALTVQSRGEPFVGKGLNGELIESQYAEVIWFAKIEASGGGGAEVGMRRIYRRVLVIAPWVEMHATTDAYRYYQNSDVSAHWDPLNNRWVPNTLGDLTKRENRYYHSNNGPGPFPHRWLQDPDELRGNRAGQDLLLNDALAFDVRVFDPGAPLLPWNDGVYQPGDPGWGLANSNSVNATSFGAFVDLGWGRIVPNEFNQDYYWPANAPEPSFIDDRMLEVVQDPSLTYSRRGVRSGTDWRFDTGNNNLYAMPATYDTWSSHYEKDGVDQDNRDTDDDWSTGADEGRNGFDDDDQNGVDDAAERETAAPYDAPLRAVQVRLRVYERAARQVREATVVRSFEH